ncbi:MAG: glycosyltransferase family 4 protein [Flexistipes sinusarabici]|uniref:Glycosyltransferase family 4 protein n=1 Tax=Flexistipes sinusarabici TaxID=2352 RepID=A0A5D0MP37_FLESI|nr:glycosyltransferase family 4 protein [Flexistipes sinusarabici]TYB33251.1 MAG: glycosyltransferase family 4 protein [Flexistipes sinusarabici]
MTPQKILIINNSITSLINFRKELIQQLIESYYDVYFTVPEVLQNDQVQELISVGANYIQSYIQRRNINPYFELKALFEYKRIIKEIRPDLILSFTIKPNVYGSYIAQKFKIPIIVNITGLGSGFNNNSIKPLVKKMYKYACKNASFVFFQNEDNYNYFINNKLAEKAKSKIIPGSGVNLEKFKPMKKTKDDGITRFLFIGRIMKEKGIEEYLEAAQYISDNYSNVEFQILGPYEEEKYRDLIFNLNNSKIRYLGKSDDVRKEVKEVSCIINPTFYPEGMSNVLLEGAAMGKPLIASNIPGCKEIVEDGVNGYLAEPKNTQKLIEKIEQFLKLSSSEKEKLGKAARQKVEENFDRNIVIKTYLETIDKILN